MNCEKAQQWISMSLDGELSSSRRRQLDSHLSSCDTCKAVMEEWRSYGVGLRSRVVPAGDSTEQVWAKVKEQIDRGRSPATEPLAFPVSPGLRWAALLLLVIAGIGSLYWMQSRENGGTMVAEEPSGTIVEWVETDLPGATPMVYEDAETGLTVIWVVEGDDDHAGS